MSYIAYPLHLAFKLDKSRHSVEAMEYFQGRDNKITLTGDIKAQVGLHESEAVEKAKNKAKEFIASRYARWGLAASDFKLHLRTEAVEGGEVWGPGSGIGREYNLRD